MKTNKLPAIIAALFIVLAALSLFLITKPHRTVTPSAPPGIEKGSATSTVGLDGTDKLNSLLLTEQFIAVKKAVSDYIKTKVSASVIHAQITPDSTVLNSDGSINFTVKVGNPAKTFTVAVQRPSQSILTFQVVGQDTEPVILYPYAQQ